MTEPRAWFDFANALSPAAWATIGGAIPAVITACWTWRLKTWDRGDTRETRQAENRRLAEDRLRQDQQSILDRQRDEIAGLQRQMTEMRTAHGSELVEQRRQVMAAEDERDLWEARARWWYARAHDLLGKWREVHHMLTNYSGAMAVAIARFGVPDPQLDGPSEGDEKPRLPARIEDIKDEA